MLNKQSFTDVSKHGFKPAVFFDSSVFDYLNDYQELKNAVNIASKIGFLVFRSTETDFAKMRSLNKLHVSRFGHIDPMTEASIKRRKGVIVSGDYSNES